MLLSPRTLSPLALGLLLATPLAAQNVWVVDASGGPGFDFVSIQPAIDAATDGDLILVRAGSYPGPHLIDGKQLVLQSDGVVSDVYLQIRNMAADQYVSVRSLGLSGGDFADNAGPVVVVPESPWPAAARSRRSNRPSSAARTAAPIRCPWASPPRSRPAARCASDSIRRAR